MITPKELQSLILKRRETVRLHLVDRFDRGISEAICKNFRDPFLNTDGEVYTQICLSHHDLQFLDVFNFAYKVMCNDWEITEIEVQDEYFNKVHELLCHGGEKKIGNFTVTQFKEIFASKVKSGAPKKSFTLTLKLKL